jgi:hypothetical protein
VHNLTRACPGVEFERIEPREKARLTIDNLELLEGSLREFGLCELLQDYSRECTDRFVSLHNLMASFPKYSRNLFESQRVRAAFSCELGRLEGKLDARSPDK